MIATLAIGAVGLVAAFLVYAATRPDTFRVSRGTTVAAAPERILALVGDFRNWAEWSPWEKRDPVMKRSFDGAESGHGAVYAWEGNRKVGAGRMEIAAISSTRVTIKLDFIRPFEGHNIAEFALEPQGDATRVIWAMHGPSSYMAKLMGIFLDMDRLVGRDFEAGLASLKAVAEGQGEASTPGQRIRNRAPVPG